MSRCALFYVVVDMFSISFFFHSFFCLSILYALQLHTHIARMTIQNYFNFNHNVCERTAAFGFACARQMAPYLSTVSTYPKAKHRIYIVDITLYIGQKKFPFLFTSSYCHHTSALRIIAKSTACFILQYFILFFIQHHIEGPVIIRART